MRPDLLVDVIMDPTHLPEDDGSGQLALSAARTLGRASVPVSMPGIPTRASDDAATAAYLASGVARRVAELRAQLPSGALREAVATMVLELEDVAAALMGVQIALRSRRDP